MTGSERVALLEDEFLLVRHSGEIPEVALQSSLYFLCQDAAGPRFQLSPEERTALEEAALARYREMLLRDLDLSNRDLPLFRGLQRASLNWARFMRFSEKTGQPCQAFQKPVANALVHYLRLERAEVAAQTRSASVNCSADVLLSFACALGIDPASLPDTWACLCQQQG